jgi:hypothetical protein
MVRFYHSRSPSILQFVLGACLEYSRPGRYEPSIHVCGDKGLTPPMTPNPPAFVTAAASFGPAATFIPASITGCLILSMSVTAVLICSRGEYQRRNQGRHGSWDVRGDAMVDLVDGR